MASISAALLADVVILMTVKYDASESLGPDTVYHSLFSLSKPVQCESHVMFVPQ